jgi:hypothetical protein
MSKKYLISTDNESNSRNQETSIPLTSKVSPIQQTPLHVSIPGSTIPSNTVPRSPPNVTSKQFSPKPTSPKTRHPSTDFDVKTAKNEWIKSMENVEHTSHSIHTPKTTRTNVTNWKPFNRNKKNNNDIQPYDMKHIKQQRELDIIMRPGCTEPLYKIMNSNPYLIFNVLITIYSLFAHDFCIAFVRYQRYK